MRDGRTIHLGAYSAEKALCRFANLVMRGHAQMTFSDTEAEIAEAWTSWSIMHWFHLRTTIELSGPRWTVELFGPTSR